MTQEGLEWKVLAVDDDAQKLDELERVLSTRMGDDVFVFTKVTVFDEGIKLIENNRFDLVFLDVHEASGDPNPSDNPAAEDQRGEEILRHIRSVRFLPVIFYTGYPVKVEHLRSMVVKVVDKGATTDEIRAAVTQVMDTRLPQLLRYIEEQSRAYVWESLDGLLESHEGEINAPDVSLLLARRLAASLSQNIVKEMIGEDVSRINPLEMYQYPPSESSCNPADIYRNNDEGSLWMVLTPACDFDQNKADNVLLAKVVPLVEHHVYSKWKEEASKFEAIPEGGQGKEKAKEAMNSARGKVISLVKGKLGERYRFLPGTFFLPDCVVDFQELVNYPKDSAKDFKVVCSLDNPYREEMLHFFSKYYGRIGTPDYDYNPVWQKIEGNFNPN